MLDGVVESTNARGFPRIDQPFTTVGDEQRLHVAFRLRQIEQLAAVRAVPHLQDAF